MRTGCVIVSIESEVLGLHYKVTATDARVVVPRVYIRLFKYSKIYRYRWCPRSVSFSSTFLNSK